MAALIIKGKKNDNSNFISSSNSERDKKMTNQMIILMEQMRLYDEGVLKGTGRKVRVLFQDGYKDIEEIEPIHTYQYWKNHGYQVQKRRKGNYTNSYMETCNKEK